MISLVAFDLDGTLAESKQPLKDSMGEALADLLVHAHVAVISGGDWPQFQKQVASRLPPRADLSRLWLMPTTGTKLYTPQGGRGWEVAYAELFGAAERQEIIGAFEAALEATGFRPEQTWGERIEDRGSQITFSALGQCAPRRSGTRTSPSARSSRPTCAPACPGCPSTWAAPPPSTSPGRGVDKAYGLQKLRERERHPPQADDVHRRRHLPRRERLPRQGARAGNRAREGPRGHACRHCWYRCLPQELKPVWR